MLEPVEGPRRATAEAAVVTVLAVVEVVAVAAAAVALTGKGCRAKRREGDSCPR